jgi:hypothetical protein
LVANIAKIVAPKTFLRKVTTLQNKTGGDIFVGGSGVGVGGSATEGITVLSGQSFHWKNSAALYAISATGGKVVRLDEE